MRLIIGLGNPEKKYGKTRHNVGYLVIDALAKNKPEGVILVKPKTFMNQSGKTVKKLMTNSQRSIANLWVIHDDIDLPLGEFRIQKGRGSAGHKGVQSIIDELGSKDFWRVRIGVCPQKGKPKNIEKFVLQNFSKEEEEIIKKTIKAAIQEVETKIQ